MPSTGLVAQVDRVERLERDLAAAKQQAGRVLRLAREIVGLSLRDVASRVRLSHQTIANLESGKNWQTETARRVARCYDTHRAA